ncbi:MAG TPA: type II toxin-antitoxin system VapC family toxin [Elusimicrobiota bacterium]|nr:type II toxin-antitoxin system VapC family toxin [Elusimicrobiota bacterium]
MASYLLDTSVIIDVLNGRNEREKLLERLLKDGHTLACCAINVAEIYAGLRAKEEEDTGAFLESLDYMEITFDIARQAGLFKRDFAKKGLTLSVADCLLAATAVSNRCVFITDNIKDFPMKGLALYPLSAEES